MTGALPPPMYNDLKTIASEALSLSKDALHVHLGLAIFCIVTLLFFRRRLASPWPWVATLAAALANEVLDLRGHLGLASYWLEGAKDIANTMLWPTIAWVALRTVSQSRRHSNTDA